MPTYEYACSSCAHEWEAEQSIKEDALKDCPSCNQPTAKRQISRGTGFILKGGGWYADLYSGGSNQAASKGSEKSGGEKSGGASSGGASSGGEASSTKSEGSSSSGGTSTSSSGTSGSSGSSSGSSTTAAA